MSVFKIVYPEAIYSVLPPVTIVIGIPWSEIKEDQRQLLSKILQAVRLTLESVKIICQPSFDLSLFSEKPQRMIAFIAPPKGLALYEVIAAGEASVVFSDALATLNTDEAAKRKFWNTLKGLFSP